MQLSVPNIPDALAQAQKAIEERDAMKLENVRLEAAAKKNERELEEYRRRFGPLQA